jgi:hypothetical protein
MRKVFRTADAAVTMARGRDAEVAQLRKTGRLHKSPGLTAVYWTRSNGICTSSDVPFPG